MIEFTFFFVRGDFDLRISQAFENTSKGCLTFLVSSSNLGEKTYPLVMQYTKHKPPEQF